MILALRLHPPRSRSLRGSVTDSSERFSPPVRPKRGGDAGVGHRTHVSVAGLTVCALLLTGSSMCRADSPDTARDPLTLHARGGAIWLVQFTEVADELGLTPEQRRQTRLWRDEVDAEQRRLFNRLFGGQGPEHDRLMTRRREQERALIVEYNRQVLALLDEDQVRRLDELYVQCLGVRALFNERIATRLQLDDQQRTRLREAAAARLGEPSKLFEILTPEQRARHEAMTGQPFAVPPAALIEPFPD